MAGEVARCVMAAAASENHLLVSFLAIPFILGGVDVSLGRTVSPLIPSDGELVCGTGALTAVIVGE